MSTSIAKKLSVKVWAAAVLFVFAMVLTAGASGVDMTGKWTMAVEKDGSTGNPVFDLKQEGAKLTGTYAGKFGEAPVTGSVEGGNFSITYEMSGVVVTYAGTTDGATCKGEVDYGMYGTGTFTGKK